MLYDAIQISGPTDNFVIDGNVLDRTISNGTQWNAINLQGDAGKVLTNGIIRHNLMRGKFDGIHIAADGRREHQRCDHRRQFHDVDGPGWTAHRSLERRPGLRRRSHEQLLFDRRRQDVWDNRSNPLPAPAVSGSCADPTSSISITAPAPAQTVTGMVSLQASAANTTVGVQFKVDGAAYGGELASLPF